MAIDPRTGYPMPSLHYVETMGNAASQADSIIENIDTQMRNAYDTHIARVGNNIYPVLYVDFTLVGGRYTLVLDEERSIVRAPDLRSYAQLKSVAHTPLGIFVQIAEYAQFPNNGQWIQPLTAYGQSLQQARAQIASSGLSHFEQRACETILAGAISYINNITSARSFTMESFREFTRPLYDVIQFCMSQAAKQQVTIMGAVVDEFKTLLGPRWDEVFVVVAALWTLTQENVHELIIGSRMKPELRETNLIVSEAAETLADAQNLLGRIVGDRIAAHYVFSRDDVEADRENIYSLSTARDLLSQAAEALLIGNKDSAHVMTEDVLQRMCPHMAK